MTKLRRTVIYGIPCDFVKFDEYNKDITEKLMNEKEKNEAEQSDDTANRSTSSAKSDKQPQNQSSPNDFIECLNMRAEIWDIMCNIDGLKKEMLKEYEEERQRRERTFLDPNYDQSYEINEFSKWCTQFNEDEEEKYNEEHGGMGPEGYIRQMRQRLPEINDANELYNHYKSFHTPHIKYDISKDLHRTDINNLDFRND